MLSMAISAVQWAIWPFICPNNCLLAYVRSDAFSIHIATEGRSGREAADFGFYFSLHAADSSGLWGYQNQKDS